MKKNAFLLLSLLTGYCLMAQESKSNYEIGYYVDTHKNTIDGFSEYDYSPKPDFGLSYYALDNYMPGYYYSADGYKLNGYLKQDYKTLYFKINNSNPDEIGHVIRPENCLGFVIGVDSFAVINNVKVQRDLIGSRSKGEEYARVIGHQNGLTFFEHKRIKLNNTIVSHIVKSDTSDIYESFPKIERSFKEIALVYFGEVELLKNGIEQYKYLESDLPKMVKILKYYQTCQQQGKIYFNANWDEIERADKSSYHAEILSINESEIHIKYTTKDGLSLYEGYFSSLYPHIKQGEFTFYYPNGNKRKTEIYNANKPTNGKTYYFNGKLRQEYVIKNGTRHFENVYDVNENPILDALGNGVENFYDNILKREIIYTYKNHSLVSAYFEDENNRKVYQLSEKNAKIKSIKTFQKYFIKNYTYPENSLKKFNQGYALVRCIIESNGIVSDLQIIKSLDTDSDLIINSALSKFKIKAHWKPGKSEGKAIAQEIVFPINFSIRNYSKPQYYFHHNYMFMDHMIFHQNISNISPPVRPF
ncbi:MAG: energy transducer TonB [Cyclobacteriaceae bacterium]